MLARLVVQRLALSQDVATAKYASCHSIEDPVRERRVLEAASALIGTGTRRDAGLRFARDQIEANRVIQRELHQRWYANPEEVWPDLDLVTIQLILRLNCMTHLPRLRLDLIEDLIGRQFAAAMPAPPLPTLYRYAALFALRSLCLEWCPSHPGQARRLAGLAGLDAASRPYARSQAPPPDAAVDAARQRRQ